MVNSSHICKNDKENYQQKFPKNSYTKMMQKVFV